MAGKGGERRNKSGLIYTDLYSHQNKEEIIIITVLISVMDVVFIIFFFH